ncbi:hypothetical protein [Pseudoalteromonas sp. MMG022]|uniref:hypothetical protein n=1 Tax=Pseudoalteromonas sp. MMG022 TaxID=2909978 RepID=UPI001F28C086|nr:hypothetical protein [Pseudoalteromonas sp. MMG022]MCF6437003.1 hypothetical protein [Pseudoalteromonas sp. MMG022]
MNKEALKHRAVELERILNDYSLTEPEAALLLKVLAPIIENAKANKIDHNVEWNDIAGSRFFTEGSLRQFPDLEKAFADFRIEATGGESPALKKLRARHSKNK